MTGWQNNANAWSKTLNPAQTAAVRRIHEQNNGGAFGTSERTSSHGWRVYMQPTTLPARYLELRHYQTDGLVSVWVIEPDGSVSAHHNQDATGLRPRSAA